MGNVLGGRSEDGLRLGPIIASCPEGPAVRSTSRRKPLDVDPDLARLDRP